MVDRESASGEIDERLGGGWSLASARGDKLMSTINHEDSVDVIGHHDVLIHIDILVMSANSAQFPVGNAAHRGESNFVVDNGTEIGPTILGTDRHEVPPPRAVVPA